MNEYAKNSAKKHKLEQKFDHLEKKYQQNILMEKNIVNDAKIIKNQINEVMNSDLEIEDKKEIIQYLKKETGKLNSTYKFLENENQMLMDEGNKVNLEILSTAAKLEKQKEEIKKVVLQSGAASLDKVNETTTKKKEEYEELSRKILDKLKNDLDEAKALREKMNNNKE